ncbi:MAG TPA: diguanylate cyclase [Gemmatimonadales bacterium]|nr:diguanylate cyclase [Gemmatimonadales bacterium]
MFAIEPEACVGCLACLRVCPADAVAVEESAVRIVDESCVRCGLCLPACPHGAISARGELARAIGAAVRGDGVLILSPEAVTHFFPATPEQLVNAAYATGFRTVTRGVIGDELVAEKYLELWDDPSWGTLIRSTDPVVVEAIEREYPELVPYLAPVTTPAEAEARYLRALHGPGIPLVFAGVVPPSGRDVLDAGITFADLDELFRRRGVDPQAQPDVFVRLPEERRRHLSLAGGMPLALLAEVGKPGARRVRTIRGLHALGAIVKAVRAGQDLGFVDLLSHEGTLDHPIAGPKEELFWRRSVVEATEPPRSRFPVVDAGVVASVGATFDIRPRRRPVNETFVATILEAIGTGPNGRPWDCRACGFPTCRRFAEAASEGRATLRQCTPYQARRADEAQRQAAVDSLTGLATWRVLRDRLAGEVERSKRSGERFALVFLDLDRFKELNDRAGHETGNRVLARVGEELLKAVRASDLAARYGGDEFVLLLPRTDLAGGQRVAETVRRRLEAVGPALDLGAGSVTASLGVTEYDPAAPPAHDLIELADRALYGAKVAGRNAVMPAEAGGMDLSGEGQT